MRLINICSLLVVVSTAFSEEKHTGIDVLSAMINTVIWTSALPSDVSLTLEKRKLLTGYEHIRLTSHHGMQVLFEGFTDENHTLPNGVKAFAADSTGHVFEVTPDLSLMQRRKDVYKVLLCRFSHGILQQMVAYEPPFKRSMLTLNYDVDSTRMIEYIGADHYRIGDTGYPSQMINIDGTTIESPNLPFVGLIFESREPHNTVVRGTLLPNFTYSLSGQLQFSVVISDKKLRHLDAFFTEATEAYATPIRTEESLGDWLDKAWGLTKVEFIDMILEQIPKQTK
jgi:hypothetical protein